MIWWHRLREKIDLLRLLAVAVGVAAPEGTLGGRESSHSRTASERGIPP